MEGRYPYLPQSNGPNAYVTCLHIYLIIVSKPQTSVLGSNKKAKYPRRGALWYSYKCFKKA